MSGLALRLRLFWQRLVQTGRLVCGVPDYEVYRTHMRRQHPDKVPMDYTSFFRERQQARYGSKTGGRCC